jgi:hypothetical protein
MRTSDGTIQSVAKARKTTRKMSKKKRAVLSAKRIAQYGDHAVFRRVVKYL